MYPAIEAIAKGGIIEPLEPVEFEDNEQLVILRLTKPWTKKGVTAPPQDWHEFVGTLSHPRISMMTRSPFNRASVSDNRHSADTHHEVPHDNHYR